MRRIIITALMLVMLLPGAVSAETLEMETDTFQSLQNIPDLSDAGDGSEAFIAPDEKSPIALNNTSLKLVKGEKVTLKLKGAGEDAKVRWSATGKGIVKLSNDKKRKCTVTAGKTGTAVIKAVYGKKTYKCSIKVVKAPKKTISFNGKKYRLSYYDEFNTLNKKRWAYCPEQERQDLGGQWRNSCSGVKNGKFVVTCKVDKDGTPISGAIRSTKDYEQTFGLYHIRFKMEKADGLWYALWLLSDGMDDSTVGNGATDGAELDMIELVPHTRELCMSVHWDGYGKHLKSYCETKHVDDDFYNRYHDLWYLWDKNGYSLYMDGTDRASRLFKFNGKKHGDGTCAVPCDLIISAEYGTWGGKIRKKQLPAHFYVDYVRVYRQI